MLVIVWQRINPLLVQFLENQKAERLNSVYRKRFNTFQSVITAAIEERYPQALVPQIIDLCMDYRVRDMLDLPPSVDLSADWISYFLVRVLSDMIESWKRDKTSQLSELFRSSCGLYIDPEVETLQLAVAIFKCSRCPEMFRHIQRYPDVLTHECLTRRTTPNTTYDYYETIASRTLDCSPWSCAALEVHRWVQRARVVIEVCGQDPARITAAEMDILDPCFFCRLCTTQLAFMDWRMAVGLESNTPLSNPWIECDLP